MGIKCYMRDFSLEKKSLIKSFYNAMSSTFHSGIFEQNSARWPLVRPPANGTTAQQSSLILSMLVFLTLGSRIMLKLYRMCIKTLEFYRSMFQN